jgi:3-isopropylmalate/(R)-2-methylmalate dehydratase small subunit
MSSSTERRLVAGRGLPLLGNDIDTDRITPARYLKQITFDGLGAAVFVDERAAFTARGEVHPFDDPRFTGAAVLVVGKNFGCGSSREHAPQALLRAGITAIVGESFGEIFAGNCTAIGIPTVRAPGAAIEELARQLSEQPATELQLDLEAMQVRTSQPTATGGGAAATADAEVAVTMPDGQRRALVSGAWDSTGALLANATAVAALAAELPYLNAFRPAS